MSKTNCPKCGHRPAHIDPVTIERTSKVYKAIMLIGAALCMAGVLGGCIAFRNLIVGVASGSTAAEDATGTYVVLLWGIGFAGLIVVIGGKIAAWWNNG